MSATGKQTSIELWVRVVSDGAGLSCRLDECQEKSDLYSSPSVKEHLVLFIIYQRCHLLAWVDFKLLQTAETLLLAEVESGSCWASALVPPPSRPLVPVSDATGTHQTPYHHQARCWAAPDLGPS